MASETIASWNFRKPAMTNNTQASQQVPVAEKPLCRVRGMIAPGGMCGYVIVGAKYCGYAGQCPHKQDAALAKENAHE